MDHPVLRVTHLDTQELDESLLEQLKQSLNQDYFKYMQTDFFQRYHAEIFAAIKLFLWYHTYYKGSQTISQSIFDWSYSSSTSSSRKMAIQKLLHGCFYCLDEWFEERFLGMIKTFLVYTYNRFYRVNDTLRRNFQLKVDRFFALIKMGISWLSLFNYFAFLVNGKYLHWWERLLRLKAFYESQQNMPNFNHEISQKEMLWQAYFSLFKLLDSLFDLNRVYRKFADSSGLLNQHKTQELRNEAEERKICAICENEPTMVHCAVNSNESGACKHVYCYSCIRRALNDSDNKYVCKLCSKTVYDCEMLINNKNL